MGYVNTLGPHSSGLTLGRKDGLAKESIDYTVNDGPMATQRVHPEASQIYVLRRHK
jgi:hypothetical protein